MLLGMGRGLGLLRAVVHLFKELGLVAVFGVLPLCIGLEQLVVFVLGGIVVRMFWIFDIPVTCSSAKVGDLGFW